MSSEKQLLERWRDLPQKERSEVIDFVEFLHQRKQAEDSSKQQSRGQRLLELRQEIVNSGIPLLNDDELEAEIASRRGGVEG